MKLNIIDRVLAQVAPGQALQRLASRARVEAAAAMAPLQVGAFLDPENSPPGPTPGSSSSRFWKPRARDARTDTVPYLADSRGQSRNLARHSPIAVGAIDTNVNRVVGTGLALSALPNRDVLGWTVEQQLAWKKSTQAEFSLWADSPECDICQELNFYEQQALVLRSTLESGDVFTVLPDGKRTATQPYALRIQLIEADRCGNPQGKMDTPTLSGGVQIDANGAPQRFHIYDRHPGGAFVGGVGDMWAGVWIDRIGNSGRRRILHHYRKKRPGQPRGIPYLAPITECIKQISRYTEAEIMAAVISAYFTVFIETPNGTTAPVFDGADPVAGVQNEIGLDMGAVVGLQPGEKVHDSNPSRPNPNFGPFIESVITQIGMALSLPRELLIKQFNASYSASKAALLDAAVYFRTVRTWLALSFCQPVYETWLAEAVATGRVSAPGFFSDPLLRWAYTRAAWPGDSMGSINPKDEVKAYSDAIDARIMTRERAEWELFGTDFNDTFDTKKSEHDRLKEADMLPVPKAGAAAPAPGGDNDPIDTPITKEKP